MSEPRFWRMQEPEYRSDYQSSFVNGGLEHPFGLPGVHCEVCGATWGGCRVLPYPCPESLRERRQLLERWPLAGPTHRSLRLEIAERLREEGYEVGVLLPGDSLQPNYLDVPSQPRADFLWASLGSVVVSERIRLFFSELAADAVTFTPVSLRKIGKREARLPAPLPASGEPDGTIRGVERLPSAESVGPYYEMIVQAESGLPRGGPALSVCEGCGRQPYDNNARVLAMYPEMWQGAPVFMLATTLWIIVTDEVRRTLQGMGATNVAFVSV